MKKSLFIALAIGMILIFSSCGAKTDTTTKRPVESPPPSSIVVDENLMTVDITLPAYFFEDKDMSAFNAEKYAQEQGFKKAVLNEDGSVTVTMTKANHKKMLKELTNEYDTSFAEMVESDNTPYIKSIKHSDNFNSITVEVDRAAYEAAAFDLTQLTLGLTGMMYQLFSGDEKHVEVSMKDVDTGYVIKTIVYPDVIDQESSETESNY